jgi:predicted nucleotidyltransferase
MPSKPGFAMSEFNLMPEKIARYRSTAIERRERSKEALALRKEVAWSVARKAAKLLKQRFGATRVIIFGSLVNEDSFTRWSDVDVAAWGLAPDQTFQAIGAVMDLGDEVPANLVDVNTCRPSLLKVIENDGVEL